MSAAASNVGTSINSATNAGNITPGEILPGINLTSIQGGNLVSLGAGWVVALTSNGVATETFTHEMRLDLAPSVSAVGFDLTAHTTGSVNVRFFNNAAFLGNASVVNRPTSLYFVGAIAFGGDVITRVEIVDKFPVSQGVIMDNLAFGNVVPEPSSLAIFGIGAGVMGLVSIRRRRREKNQEATT